MTGKRGGIEGYRYLRKRGGSYEVRLQVPHRLRAGVGKGELKKSLGGDLTVAKRKYHRVVSELQEAIDLAKGAETETSSVARAHEPSLDDIEIASHRYFTRMAELQRGKIISLEGKRITSPKERIESLEEALAVHAQWADGEYWDAMGQTAHWLIEEMGWTLPESSPRFAFLCETLLRARIYSYRAQLRKLRGIFAPDPEADPLFASDRPKGKKAVVTLGDLKKGFEEERQKHWSLSTRKNYKIIFSVLEGICGFETPVTAIDRDYCLNIVKNLEGLPANYQKSPLTRGRSVAEAIEIALEHDMPKIAPATINNHLSKLGAIIRFGRDRGWIAGNPMSDLEVPDEIDPADKRDPFSIEQLNLIFAREPWSDGGASVQDRPSRYWAPLIAAFSGARLTEICGQRVDEMIIEDGVHAFHFRHRPNDRSIKNGKSRKVPVHPELLKLGFWDFVEEARAAGREHLFSDVRRDKLGKWGDHTSKWFSRQVEALNLKGRRLSFHSFRHSFEDALRDADLHDTPLGNALTGRWTAGVSKNYGSKYPIARLDRAIRDVKYARLVAIKPWVQSTAK